ncbi:alpha/beta fold hydrolase [Microbulbifer sp. ZKSA002]|uniref:alpha/beta fold hydrolase n=1 Tax=Microbulbifer sp. ZKSA002 TaxID=3243388 RepID=UPI0040395BF6
MELEELMAPCHIVFLPGLFARGWIWNQVADACRQQGHKITVIEPSIPEIFMGKLDSAHEMIRECLQLNGDMDNNILVGNSMSGLITLDFAAKHPELVAGLVISGAPGLEELEAGVSLSDLRGSVPGAANILCERVFRDINRLPKPDYEKGVADIDTIFSTNETFKSVIKWLNISRKYDVHESLEKVRCSIKLIWGDFDQITPAESWRSLASEKDNLDYCEVYDCGHSPMLEKPEAFYQLLSGYISSLTNPLAKTA